MIYLILGAFLAGLLSGGMGMKEWSDGRQAKHEQAQRQAQDKIDAQAAQIEAAAEVKVIDMEAAFLAGESNAKTITRTIYVKGQQNVATFEVFRNPACVLPPVVLSELNRARTGLLPAPDPAIPVPAVPAAAPGSGRPDVNAVPANASGRGNVGGVPTPPANTGGSGAVPGQSVRPVPKPTAAPG